MDGLKNLIDLSSPENKNDDVGTNQSLIPCPRSGPVIIINNPFDSVCDQIVESAEDPFEAAFNKALSYKKNDRNQKQCSKKSGSLKTRNEECERGVEVSHQVNQVSSSDLMRELPERMSACVLNDCVDEEDSNKENEDPLKLLDIRRRDVSSSETCSLKRAPLCEISVEELYLQDISSPSFLDEIDEKQTVNTRRDVRSSEDSFLKRAPLCETSVGELYLQDISSPSLLGDIDEKQTVDDLSPGSDDLINQINRKQTVDDLLTGPDLVNECDMKIKYENCMKDKKSQSVPILFSENINESVTFCGGLDMLEGVKPLGDDLVNSILSQSFVKKVETDLTSLEWDDAKAKPYLKISSTPNRASGRTAWKFSSELSPVRNTQISVSTSSSTCGASAILNRAINMSTDYWDASNVSYCLKKEECISVTNGECENDEVFIEAQKLAQSFSEGKPIDKVDDVADISCTHLNLVHANSSDEENESLRNDPSLNFNYTSSEQARRNFIEFSDAVRNYKKRRSTEPDLASAEGHNQSMDKTEWKSASFSCSEPPKSSKGRGCRSQKTAGLNVLKKQIDALPIGNNIHPIQKPKKPEVGVCSQKGAPLKATVPIQFMIRSGLNKDLEMNKKNAPLKIISRNQVPVSSKLKGRNNGAAPRPVASSTPTKNQTESFNVSPSQSLIMEDNPNHHRSFDSSELGNNEKKPARSSSWSNIPCPNQSTNVNGKANSMLNRNGLSVRNSTPTMKQIMKKPGTITRTSPNFGVRHSNVSPSPSSLVRKYGKIPPPKLILGQFRSHRDKENFMPMHP